MYTCPMHPEVKQEQPGRCPICHMDLVKEGEASGHSVSRANKGWKEYMPLIVVVVLILAVTLALSIVDQQNEMFSWTESIRYFMAGFFLVFAGFKLIDLRGFVDGYVTYDLLAQRWRGYAFLYPFLELVFGLAMVIGFHPAWVLWAEFILMAFSGVGVAIKIAKKEDFQCACLGTTLKVPLTYVTLVEDFGMAVLALILIILT